MTGLILTGCVGDFFSLTCCSLSVDNRNMPGPSAFNFSAPSSVETSGSFAPDWPLRSCSLRHVLRWLTPVDFARLEILL